MSTPKPDVTTLLGLAARGDEQAREELFRRVEGELRKRAKAHMRHEQPTPNLQTTVLVDEAYVRLIGDQHVEWQSRSQFYCCAAKVMRGILVDNARRRAAQKRGAGEGPAQLEQVAEPTDGSRMDPLILVALHEALTKLAGSYPDLIEIVELHHFGGWELKQIAEEILHVPYTTVKRRWRRAKALLYREITGSGDGAD
jgi:RNA polymerase sigma factor (TIGR02999 family)